MKLTVIAIKREDGLYHFDHSHNDTVEELLMNGTENVIDTYHYFTTGNEAVPGNKMYIQLSTEEYEDDWDTVLSYEDGDEDGTIYLDEVTCEKVWLCKWLDSYFGEPPLKIWIKIDPVNDGLDAFNDRTKGAIQNYFSKTVFNKNN